MELEFVLVLFQCSCLCVGFENKLGFERQKTALHLGLARVSYCKQGWVGLAACMHIQQKCTYTASTHMCATSTDARESLLWIQKQDWGGGCLPWGHKQVSRPSTPTTRMIKVPARP